MATEWSVSGPNGAAEDKGILGVGFYVFLLFIKGVTGMEGYQRAEGLTGHFNPVKMKDSANKNWGVSLPGLGEELLAEVYHAAPFSMENLMVSEAPMRRRNAGLLLRPPTSVQEEPEDKTAVRATEAIWAGCVRNPLESSGPLKRITAGTARSSPRRPMARRDLTHVISLWRGAAAPPRWMGLSAIVK